MLLSKTSAPLTGLALHFRIQPLRADGMVLAAITDPSGGSQFAAHRLEWQPSDGLRLGVSEGVRFDSSRLEPLYWIGLPFALVQSLLTQDEVDSSRAVHNNVEAALDAAWRYLPGQRVYGELLIDDLRTHHATNISKYGYLLGWEGIRGAGSGRLSLGAELTRLTRFVYTSNVGQSFIVQGRPLGDPIGPDARRIRLRAAWDPTVDWQVFASAARTDRGESGLDHTFTPGDPQVPVAQFLGVVEHTTELQAALRYWPASGIDVSVGGGVLWRTNLDHVAGVRRTEPEATVRLRLTR